VSAAINAKHSTAELYAAVEQSVHHWIDLANQHLPNTTPYPALSFRASGSRAGAVFLHQGRINFNRTLLTAYPDDYFNEVIPHEVAHWAVHRNFGRVKPHGKEWQHVMSDIFGVEPKTTHQLDTSVLNRKTFKYVCDCSSHQLSVRRHNAICRNKVQYHCKKCNGVLTAFAE
jgi:SprT protein